MSREEIVNNIGYQLTRAAIDYIEKHEFADSMDCFEAGAEWMQKKMIDKACEWIEAYLFDIGFPDDWCRDSATMKSGKQKFLEAMEN